MEERPSEPGERIEREVIVERTTTGGGADRPARSPMWAWVIPLVIVVLVLMWYVITRGEPSALFGVGAGDQIELAALLEVIVAF